MRSFLHGAVHLHILHHAAEHPIHGAWMAAELARHGYRISPGTLYPMLHRLGGAGVLGAPDGGGGGRGARRRAPPPPPPQTPAAPPWPRPAMPCANSPTNSSSDQPTNNGAEVS